MFICQEFTIELCRINSKDLKLPCGQSPNTDKAWKRLEQQT